MRAILDTNVVISALGGNPGASPALVLARLWRGEFELILSNAILEELRSVLARPANLARIGWTQFEAEQFVISLSTLADIVPSAPAVSLLSDEPDNRLLEAAEAGHADYLVSGDMKVLEVGTYGETQILTPAAFLAVLRDVAPEPEG